MKKAKGIRVLSKSGRLYTVKLRLVIMPFIIIALLAAALAYTINAYNKEADRVAYYSSIVANKEAEIKEHEVKYDKLVSELDILENMVVEAEESVNKLMEQ